MVKERIKLLQNIYPYIFLQQNNEIASIAQCFHFSENCFHFADKNNYFKKFVQYLEYDIFFLRVATVCKYICSNFLKNASSFQESTSTFKKMVSILLYYFHFSENYFQFPEKKQISSKKCSLSILLLFFIPENGHCFQNT